MNFFINQGRCRVCGKMCCCFKHQKEHENTHHKEYKYLLDKLPISCKKCSRNIYCIKDLNLRCHLMNQFFMNGEFNSVLLTKPNRKRPLKESDNSNETLIERITIPNESRKILIPIYKFKQIHFEKFLSSSEFASRVLFLEFNRFVTDSQTMISSPLNVSYKCLANNVLKSSTPLTEQENNNSPVIGVNVTVTEKSTYTTPEVVQNSIVIISSKKNTPPGIMTNFSKRITKKIVKNRKVSFELLKTPETNELTIYSTPTTTIEIINEIDEENIDEKLQQIPPGCLLVKMVKKIRTAIHWLPKSLSNVWNWNRHQGILKKSRDFDEPTDSESCSPLKKRPKFESHTFLHRRPISSHWVNMSVSSLMRKPLSNYEEKLLNGNEIF